MRFQKFVQKEHLCGFLKLLFTKDQRIAQIEVYHRRITTSVASFQVSSHLRVRTIEATDKQISALMSIHTWQRRNDDARAADQKELNEQLTYLETNQRKLMETLGA